MSDATGGGADGVTVVVATRNSARTLEACLRSIRSQTYPSVEIIVVDNASDDATATIAERLADTVLYRGPERSAQRNAGVAAARGRFVLIVDSDMRLNDDVVAACVSTWEREPCIVWIPEVSVGEGYWARCKALEREFYSDDSLVAAARFFERDLFLAVGGYDEGLHATEDWDLSMRAERLQPLRRAEARIVHDDGKVSFASDVRRKFYYGASHLRFIEKHGAEARKRLSPLRGSLLRNAGRIVAHPVVGTGLVVLKAAQLVAAVAGRVLVRRALRAADVYATRSAAPATDSAVAHRSPDSQEVANDARRDEGQGEGG